MADQRDATTSGPLIVLPDLDALRTPHIAPPGENVSGNLVPLARCGTFGIPGMGSRERTYWVLQPTTRTRLPRCRRPVDGGRGTVSTCRRLLPTNHHGRVGPSNDDLPEIEVINEEARDESAAEAVVATGPRLRRWWLMGILVLATGAVIASNWSGADEQDAWPTSTSALSTSTTMTQRADASNGLAVGDGAVSGGLPTYDLGIAGATLLDDEASRPRGLPVTVWANADAYLSLAVRPGEPGQPGTQQRPGPCLDALTPVDWLSDAQGSAWVDIRPGEPVAALCWHRSSGDLWMLRAYWTHGTPPVADREEHLRLWSLAIRPDGQAGTSNVLEDEQMRRVASDPGGLTWARARVWDYRGHEIVLFVIENGSASGLDNLLDSGSAERTSIDGLGDILVTDTSAAWVVPADRQIWATLSVQPELSTELNRILAELDGPISAASG